MADKFPEINDVEVQQDDSNEDFLSREQEILGDDAEQFKTEQDDEYLKEDQDDELKKFEQQFPDVGDSKDEEKEVEQEEEQEEEEFQEPVSKGPKSEPEAVKEWRERYNLEISKRDEADAKKAEETKKEAEKQLDDFYDDYNNKKESDIAKTKEAEKEFLSKRDEFYQKGDVWSRALDLTKDIKGNERFKELLEAKNKATKA
ncbi:Midasin [Wickerhamomyces ciferrii]|uniref:Clathrin light chain n=1 Tax=Wickerhamomyces ciferrii (strain ATCC 14091 / BCRC 22168 / CBS 111 / JCM 3599 / NBRC 0793 / NRRL Y-1031 F-60-10) TaxID=1206466 RepID=K0KNG2_WICCF|nr:Midasin [Wickerhamomyces ciferrii]CCH44536.1 Midasin [Wickerhamomyces ciferrii]